MGTAEECSETDALFLVSQKPYAASFTLSARTF